jgi:hypothetical protein
MSTKEKAVGLSLRTKLVAGIGALVVAGGGIAAVVTGLGGGNVAAPNDTTTFELSKVPAFWPSAFVSEEYEEPPFEDDPSRTNNAFNVQGRPLPCLQYDRL